MTMTAEPHVLCVSCKEKVPLKTILRGNTDRVLICPSCMRDNVARPDSQPASPRV